MSECHQLFQRQGLPVSLLWLRTFAQHLTSSSRVSPTPVLRLTEFRQKAFEEALHSDFNTLAQPEGFLPQNIAAMHKQVGREKQYRRGARETEKWSQRWFTPVSLYALGT